jgi:hypothetical protein
MADLRQKSVLLLLCISLVIILTTNAATIDQNTNSNVDDEIASLFKDDGAVDRSDQAKEVYPTAPTIDDFKLAENIKAADPGLNKDDGGKKKSLISVAGIDDDGKRVDAVIKSSNLTNARDVLEDGGGNNKDKVTTGL